jgi:outer membrane biosynthesis protein TonB
VSQPINLEDGSVLKLPSSTSAGAISTGEGDLNNGTQFDAELSPNTNGGARRAGFSTTRAKTAVFALAGACAVVFGASFAAAALTGDDEPEKAGPAVAADTPSGRSLDLGGVARLPGLREQPSPEPAVPRQVSAASAHVPEPASSSEPEPAAPLPEPVAPPPEPATPAPVPVAQAPEPQPVPSPEPQPVTQPSQPAPQPSQPAPQPSQPAPIEVYDSGG